MAELERVKTLGVKPPQNLWEYKVNFYIKCIMSCILIFKVKEDSLKVRRSVKVVDLPVWKLLSLMNKQAFEK